MTKETTYPHYLSKSSDKHDMSLFKQVSLVKPIICVILSSDTIAWLHGAADYILERLNEIMKGETLIFRSAVCLMNATDSSVLHSISVVFLPKKQFS